jgi:asparagine synthase (glutamine-hydrolysing)
VCGIAGFVSRRADPAALARMLSSIAHRGPDGQGEWCHPSGQWHAHLGHRRLAIIDLVTGAQPMGNEDGSVMITFNGEIYDFVELRAELERQGHVFKTRSDTETIIHHFEQHGVRGIGDLNGMFAFAIWDSRERSLVLGRDRAGIKPLYYGQLDDGGIAFASELSPLLVHGAIRREVSTEGLVSYLFSDYVHAPLSMVRDVKKLPPAHTVVWRDGRLEEPRRYWTVPAPAGQAGCDEPAQSVELWRRLDRAVRSQLVADVPVGIFLSGGIDSSSVATLAAANEGQTMKAFSIAFEDETFDESRYARLVAKGLRVDHVCETLHARNLLEVMDEALDKLDEPLADPSLLPTYLLSRLAAKHVKVVVGGDGGDELWGGYPTYRAHRYGALYAKLPTEIRSRLAAGVDHLPIQDRYQSLEWKLRRFTQRWDDDVVRRHLRWMSTVDLPELQKAILGSRGIEPSALSAELPETPDWLHRLLALDFTTYMPGSVLTKVDRAAMAHGLEVRPPILDNHMIDWAFSLPSRCKVRARTGKYLFKRAARRNIPDVIIDRPKQGFGIPLGSWMRGALKERLQRVLGRSPLWDMGLLARDTFQSWYQEHEGKQRDRSKPLWAMLVLDHWLQKRML